MPMIGIDLGTTNSLVAHFTENGPEIIPNSFGEHLTPSIVSVGEDGEIYTGKIAAERRLTSPESTASVFKRNMGSKMEFHLAGRTFLPEELSSLILKKLKEDAEIRLGEPVEEAVVSVPAYFSDAQRRATKTAGELAGLRVERLVSEPTAAAIAYGLDRSDNQSRYLIFDLGGGTFDVSILEFSNHIMEVRAVAGDNFLGGEDFNDVLQSMFCEETGVSPDGLTPGQRAALRKAAETTKLAFSKSRMAVMQFAGEDRIHEATFSIKDFEAHCAPVLDRLKTPVVRALSDAAIRLADIDAIILVGGATKLPVVRSFVARIFGRLPAAGVNPDEAVALGAAVQAAMKARNETIRELLLTDVCPYTLGTDIAVRMSGGLFQAGNFLPIIERNTVIPVSRVERLYTLHDDQKEVEVDILQGESRKTKDNIFLGRLNIPVPPAPAGEEAVDVRYTYDINGILEVEVTTVSNGATETMIIEKNPGAMSQEEIRRRFKELAALKIHPRDQDEYRFLMERGERLFREHTGDVRQEIGEELRIFESALESQERKSIDTAAADLRLFFDTLEEDF